MPNIKPISFQTKNNSAITFRSFQDTDLHLYSNFQKKIASETTNTLQYVGQQISLETVRIKWQDAREELVAFDLGAFDDEKLVRGIGFWQEDGMHPWKKHVGVFGIMILQDYWGQGIAKEMLSIMHEHAKKVEITRIQAIVRTKNEAGIHLYLKGGYIIEGTKKNAICIGGNYEDEYYIAKIL